MSRELIRVSALLLVQLKAYSLAAAKQLKVGYQTFGRAGADGRLLKMVDGLNFKDFVAFLSAFSARASLEQKVGFIFKVYDSDGNGKVSFNDILEVLQDLSGSFMSDEQREQVLCQVLKEAGYSRESYLMLDDFIKVFGHSGLKMEVEVPVD
ncbi:hypothetical protein GH714_033679 [Hevea brasiliensis]|uniref:EF-hand domain-containing protein n=1 Tax=Hevea brasiliensis TaxID=3981 RepID=A0A6A6NBX1_HEVBR|nr:hypothetical protein GH714_033679 [Hevea brasiliensis]